ncbi:hypothetical protein EDB19DRAFT_1752897 [Suillus lakei]|nr:hypothetical protein EDB19DRAFT_1752897 [Suillus lakei]
MNKFIMAINLLGGGVIINALLEQVRVVVNHQISTERSNGWRPLQAPLLHLTRPLCPYSNPDVLNDGLELPSVPPCDDTTPFHLLSGTIYNSHRYIFGSNGIMEPRQHVQ